MALEKRLQEIVDRQGLPGLHFESNADDLIDDMATGDHAPSSVLYSRMMRAAHDLRTFDEAFELLCLDYLDGRIDLLDFQLEAARDVFQRMNLRGILADEVGLGKTIEAGIIAKELKTRGMLENLLVLAPKTLLNQWQAEFRNKFDIHLKHARSNEHELKTTKGEDGGWMANLRSWYWSNSDIRDPILAGDWDLVIVDEAHHLKNHETKRYQSMLELDNQYLLLLTATPIQNSLQELYSLIHLVRPGALGDYYDFRNRFFRDKRGQRVKRADELRRIVSQNMIRRRRVECGVDYTDRNPQVHRLTFPESHGDIYRELFDIDVQALHKVNWLKMASSSLRSIKESLSGSTQIRHSKEYEPLWQAIRDAEEEGEPKHEALTEIVDQHPRVVVFTEYTETMRSIADHLEEEIGELVHLLHGGMSLKQRRESIRAFKDQGGAFVSTRAGSEGINLQFCNVIVNYDLPWNPMKVEQRIGRVHRIGQENEVYVHTLSYEGTIEDFILSSLYRKLQLFKMSVGEVDHLFTQGTDDDEFELERFLREQIGDRASLENLRENLEDLGERLEGTGTQDTGSDNLTSKVLG